MQKYSHSWCQGRCLIEWYFKPHITIMLVQGWDGLQFELEMIVLHVSILFPTGTFAI